MSLKIGFLKNFTIRPSPGTLLKRGFKIAVFREYCRIFKKTLFYETPLVSAFENLVYDFNCKFIPESSIKSVSKIFPLCFIQSFVSKEEEKLSKFILTKNYVNMEVPIDSFIIKERVSNTEREHSWNDSNSIRYFGPIISDMVSPEVKS